MGVVAVITFFWPNEPNPNPPIHLSVQVLGTVPAHPGSAHTSGFFSSYALGVSHKCFYNHAHRLRLKKLLYLELSRRSNGYFKPLLNSGAVT